MAEQTPDLSGVLGKLLENPEALKSAMAIASNLKKSGFLDGLTASESGTGEKNNEKSGSEGQMVDRQLPPVLSGEYRNNENAYTEQKDAGDRFSKRSSDGGRRQSESAHRKQLLMALRPYMSRERQERIDMILKILRLLELADQLGTMNLE